MRTGRRARAGCAALVVLLLGTSPAFAAERVVTLAPHLAELACAAGGCDRLVGVVAWTDFPPQAAALPRVGDAFAVNVEQVLALAPDLVLAWDGGTPRELQERLRALGLRVESVRVQRLEDVGEALRAVGGWLDTPVPAARAAEAYARGLAALRERHRRAAPLRVLFQIERQPLYSVSRHSPISQAIELCGGINVFADLPVLAAPVDREAVLARDPEAIVFSRQDDVRGIRADWARSPPVAATRAGALYAVDAGPLERATPRLLEGTEALCAVLNDARERRARSPRSAAGGGPAFAPRRTAGPTAG